MFQESCHYSNTYQSVIKIVHFRSSNVAGVAYQRKLCDKTQKYNQQHVGFNSCNSWKQMMYNLSLPLLSLRTVNTVTHSYTWYKIHRLFCQYFHWVKTDTILGVVLKWVQFFLVSNFAKFYVQTSGRTEVFLQFLRLYLH
jgi:hypothetical protein